MVLNFQSGGARVQYGLDRGESLDSVWEMEGEAYSCVDPLGEVFPLRRLRSGFGASCEGI